MQSTNLEEEIKNDYCCHRPANIGRVRTGLSRKAGALAIIGDLDSGSTRATALIQDICSADRFNEDGGD